MEDIFKLIIVFFGLLTALSILSVNKQKTQKRQNTQNTQNNKERNNKIKFIDEKLPNNYFINQQKLNGTGTIKKIFVRNDNQIDLDKKIKIELVSNNKNILFPVKIIDSKNNIKSTINRKKTKNNQKVLNKNNFHKIYDKIITPTKNNISKERVIKIINDNSKYDNTNYELKNKINNRNNKKIKPLSSYSHLQKVDPNSPIHHHNACSHMKYKF